MPFSNKTYTKGVPFPKKWYIKGLGVTPQGGASPYKTFWVPPSGSGGGLSLGKYNSLIQPYGQFFCFSVVCLSAGTRRASRYVLLALTGASERITRNSNWFSFLPTRYVVLRWPSSPPCAYSGLIVDSFFYVNRFTIYGLKPIYVRRHHVTTHFYAWNKASNNDSCFTCKGFDKEPRKRCWEGLCDNLF